MGGIAQVGKSAATGGGGHPGDRLFLQGGNTGGPYLSVGVMGSVGRDDEDGGEHP